MNIKQGEVWEVEFFPHRGSEIGKKRPAVVISHDMIVRLPLKTIVPITQWAKNYENYPWMLAIESSTSNGLKKSSAVDCFQVRNFSTGRFIEKIGIIDQDFLKKIHQTVIKTLNPEYSLHV